jgi:coenzyme F420-reducing hydrogenase delta subunit
MAEKMLLFYCAESAKKALNNLPRTGYTVPSTVRTMELKCSGRINEEILMESLQNGFDSVLVVGCHRENCKYLDGNLRAERRVQRIKNMLADAGIQDKRVDILLVGPDESRKLARKIEELCHISEVSP